MSDIMDFKNQNFEINPSNNNQNQKNKTQENPNNETTSTINNIFEREVVITEQNNINNNDNDQIQTSSEKFNKTFIDKFFCCLSIFKKYFQITSDDFILHFINSFIPFNNKFVNLIKNNPDLYGPIWIYTSLILLISSTESLTRTLQRNNNKNFFQEFADSWYNNIFSWIWTSYINCFTYENFWSFFRNSSCYLYIWIFI